MRALAFDIENDGFLRTTQHVWCICAVDVDSREAYRFGPEALQEGLKMLEKAEVLWAHNGLGHDLPVLRKLLNWGPKPHQKVRDSLVMARLAYSDRKHNDLDDSRPAVQALRGGHSLDDWGVRLGVRKTAYKGGFDQWSQEMEDYCVQDCHVAAALVRHLEALKLPEEALVLEHKFALEVERLSNRGIVFDFEAAEALTEALKAVCSGVETSIRDLIPDRIEELKTPAYWQVKWPNGAISVYDTKSEAETERKAAKIRPRDWELTKGPLQVRRHPFNLNSRPQIRQYLHSRYGWVSPKLTDKGEDLLKEGQAFEELALEYGSVSEDILRLVGQPEAESLADYLMAYKRLGQVANGDKAWLKLAATDGKIHHRVIPIGAATMRCAHTGPNLAQVPALALDKASGKPVEGIKGRFGYECRRCFRASPGYILVGTDLSGIEARMLAHFLAPFDGGKYIRLVLEGDIHQLNVESMKRYAGYTISRNELKIPFYAWTYGIQGRKQGRYFVEKCDEARTEYHERLRYYTKRPEKITKFNRIKGNKIPYRPSEMSYAVIGEKANNALEHGIDGYLPLKEQTQRESERGHLEVFDRRIPVRAKHSALNTRFQGGAAIIMKRWTVMTFEDVRKERLDAHLLLNIHDENQAEVRPQHVEGYKTLCLDSILRAGEWYNLAIPLAGEAKVGATWADTH